MLVLQKVLGHKGSIDIREFSRWLGPDSSPKESEEVSKII